MASCAVCVCVVDTGAGGAIEVGPIRVTMRELYVSFVSSLVILPINLLVDQLFRRSKPSRQKTEPGLHGAESTGQQSAQSNEDIQAIRSRIFQVNITNAMLGKTNIHQPW